MYLMVGVKHLVKWKQRVYVSCTIQRANNVLRALWKNSYVNFEKSCLYSGRNRETRMRHSVNTDGFIRFATPTPWCFGCRTEKQIVIVCWKILNGSINTGVFNNRRFYNMGFGCNIILRPIGYASKKIKKHILFKLLLNF